MGSSGYLAFPHGPIIELCCDDQKKMSATRFFLIPCDQIQKNGCC